VKDKKSSTRSEKKLAEQKKSALQQRVRREIAAWFWVGLIFLLVNGAVGQARVIPSGSMHTIHKFARPAVAHSQAATNRNFSSGDPR
jgi:hypothetical protein